MNKMWSLRIRSDQRSAEDVGRQTTNKPCIEATRRALLGKQDFSIKITYLDGAAKLLTFEVEASKWSNMHAVEVMLLILFFVPVLTN